jgi:uncharacterized protein (TIGR03067 family)
MKFNSQFTLLLCFSLALVGCRAEENPANSETNKLHGTWDLVYQQVNGKRLPDEKMAEEFHGKMVFVGDKIHYTVELQGFDFRFNYTLSPDQRPKAIDLRLTDAADKRSIGQELFGIYRLNENSLEICYNKSKRPVDFAAGEGSNNTLIVLKRKGAVADQ